MALFCAAIRKDSVPLFRFPFFLAMLAGRQSALVGRFSFFYYLSLGLVFCPGLLLLSLILLLFILISNFLYLNFNCFLSQLLLDPYVVLWKRHIRFLWVVFGAYEFVPDPECLVRLTCMVCEIVGKWVYSFVGYCCRICSEHCIASSCSSHLTFSKHSFSVQIVQPYSSTNTATTWKNSCFFFIWKNKVFVT